MRDDNAAFKKERPPAIILVAIAQHAAHIIIKIIELALIQSHGRRVAYARFQLIFTAKQGRYRYRQGLSGIVVMQNIAITVSPVQINGISVADPCREPEPLVQLEQPLVIKRPQAAIAGKFNISNVFSK